MSELSPTTQNNARPSEIEVISFDLDDANWDVLVGVLSADEVERARRFRFARDRLRYQRGRCLLRSVLAERMNAAPQDLVFEYGPQDKPQLAAGPLHFNLAHSETVAVVAIARHELGIDIELHRDGFADDTIAERFFAASEVHILRGLPTAAQRAAFFRCWTRKEAYLKALGGGLSIPLDDFTVEFRAGEPPAITWIRDQPDEARHWTILDLSEHLPAEATCALALRSEASASDVRFSQR